MKPGHFHRLLHTALVIAFIGCTKTPRLSASGPDHVSSVPNLNQPSRADQNRYRVRYSVHYYVDGPQQSRPPDGSLGASDVVEMLDAETTYAKVRLSNGLTVFVESRALSAIDQTRETQ